MSTQYNDTTNKNGLIQECESILFGDDYGAISGNTKKLATFTRLINHGLNDLQTLIMESDTRWQFDDSNYTDFPIGTTDLVAGQTDYTLSDSQIKFSHAYVKDQNGKYYPLKPIDERDINKAGQSPDNFMETDGRPVYYDKRGNSILLYPAPSATETTLTDGLKVSYQREPSYFVSSDTTKKAGVPATFQVYPAIVACLLYAENNQMDKKVKTLMARKEEQDARIREFYNKRDKDESPRLKARKVNYR